MNLAIALARLGSRVGIIDGDIYGPNVPIMLGVRTQLHARRREDRCRPRSTASSAVSMGFLTNDEAPVIWRGPMLHGVVTAVLPRRALARARLPDRRHAAGHGRRRAQPEPVGAGRRARSSSRRRRRVSLADTRRAVKMYEKLNVPTLGLIENMSHFVCPGCGRESDIFGKGGGEALATELGVPFLGRIPLYEPVRVGRRQRRADRHRRAGLGRRRWRSSPPPSGSAAQISIASYATHDSADAGALDPVGRSLAMEIAYTKTTLANGLDVILHEDHDPADRGRQRLVPRRLEERAARPDRLRAPLRAPDVRGLGQPRSRLLPAAAGSRRRASTARPTPTAPTTGRWCRPARSSSRCGSNRIAWASCCRR